MVDVIVPPRHPIAAVVEPSQMPDRPASGPGVDASIAAYLGAGDHMAMIMGLTTKACAALIVLVAIAWALGVLPGAVKLF